MKLEENLFRLTGSQCSMSVRPRIMCIAPADSCISTSELVQKGNYPLC